MTDDPRVEASRPLATLPGGTATAVRVPVFDHRSGTEQPAGVALIPRSSPWADLAGTGARIDIRPCAA